MGLKEKLNNIIEKPINDKVKMLQSEKDKLELIYNSLSLHSNKFANIGKGMKEYSSDVKESYENSEAKIDSIMSGKKEDLDSIGIKSIQDLVNNNDFNKEEEVIEFNEEKRKNDELKEADSKLIDRLKELNIAVEGDFSYENFEKVLDTKIKFLEKEILQEKLKTVKGKEEVVSGLSNEITEAFLQNLTYCEMHDHFCKVSLNGPSCHIILDEGYKPRLTGRPHFVGYGENSIKNMDSKYGREILLESAEKAFLDKFDTLEIENSSSNREWKISEIKKQGANIFVDAVKFELLERELKDNKELSETLRFEKMNIYGYAHREVNDFENNTKQAQGLLEEILKKEASIPDDGRVESNDWWIRIDNSEFINNEKKRLNYKEASYYKLLKEKNEYRDKEPRFFGKKKWQQELSELEGKIEKLKIENDQFSVELEKLKNTQLPSFDIKNLKDTEITSFVKNRSFSRFTKTPKEIFEEIKNKCNEILNRKMPELTIKLKEYLEIYQPK